MGRCTPGYGNTVSWLVWVEMGFGVYFTGAVIFAVAVELYMAVPFLILFQIGFLYASVASLTQQSAPEGALPTSSSSSSRLFATGEGE